MDELKELQVLPPEAFRACLDERGWKSDLLARRWGLTRRRLDQIISDADRPRYYDDAVRGLPTLPWSPATLPKDLSEGELALIERLKRSPLPMVYKRDGWAPVRYPRGVKANDVRALLQREPTMVTLELGDLRLVSE